MSCPELVLSCRDGTEETVLTTQYPIELARRTGVLPVPFRGKKHAKWGAEPRAAREPGKAVLSPVNQDLYRNNTKEDRIFTEIPPGDHDGMGFRP
jgi:hypothetical protein